MEKYEFRWFQRRAPVFFSKDKKTCINGNLPEKEFQVRTLYDDLDGIARYTEWKTVPTEIEYV